MLSISCSYSKELQGLHSDVSREGEMGKPTSGFSSTRRGIPFQSRNYSGLRSFASIHSSCMLYSHGIKTRSQHVKIMNSKRGQQYFKRPAHNTVVINASEFVRITKGASKSHVQRKLSEQIRTSPRHRSCWGSCLPHKMSCIVD